MRRIVLGKTNKINKKGLDGLAAREGGKGEIQVRTWRLGEGREGGSGLFHRSLLKIWRGELTQTRSHTPRYFLFFRIANAFPSGGISHNTRSSLYTQ